MWLWCLASSVMAAPIVGPEELATGFGGAISVGDVDGDGEMEVAVGADRDSRDFRAGGVVHVYRLGPGGLAPFQTLVIPGEYARGGASLALDGDLNADGFADLVVGAPGRGRVYVYLGSPGGFGDQPSWKSGARDGFYGQSVAHLGDLDGDGFGDFAAGAPWSPNGVVTVTRGGPQGPTESWAVQSDTTGDRFGWSVARGEDHKGRPLVWVGAPDHDGKGRVVGYRAKKRGLQEAAQLRGEQAGGQFGMSVHQDDEHLVVGVPFFMVPFPGQVQVFTADALGSPGWVVTGPDPAGAFGSSVVLDDDLLVVGAFMRDGGAVSGFQLQPDGGVLALEEDVRTDSPSGGFGSAVASFGRGGFLVSAKHHPELRVPDRVELWFLEVEEATKNP